MCDATRPISTLPSFLISKKCWTFATNARYQSRNGDNLRRVIPAAFSRWRRTVHSQLTKSFPGLAPVFKKFRTLDHPATVFGCQEPLCKKTLRSVAYADLILHPCCHRPHSLAKFPASFGGSVYNHAAQSHFVYWPWSADTLTTHEASDKVKAIMAACGADPNSTSWKKMDEKPIIPWARRIMTAHGVAAQCGTSFMNDWSSC